MRIINRSFLKAAALQYPKAAKYLEAWHAVVRKARWRGIADVRKTYRSADPVQVRSKRVVVIFNVCGNDYRLIAAFHYDRQIAYTLRFLTHADYSKDSWKEQL